MTRKAMAAQQQKLSTSGERHSNSTAGRRFAFDPVFTKQDVEKFEAKYNETWGVKRRLTMISLSRSGDQMLEGALRVGDGSMLLDMVEQIQDYEDHLKSGIEMTGAAIARLLTVAQYINDAAGSKVTAR